MASNHILNEIALRLRTAPQSRIEQLAREVGIDPVVAKDPPTPNYMAPMLDHPEQTIAGAVTFELAVSSSGSELAHTCRAAFQVELVDDHDRETGEPLRIVGKLSIDWQILDWRDLEDADEETGEHPRAAVPSWTKDFEALLPPAFFIGFWMRSRLRPDRSRAAENRRLS